MSTHTIHPPIPEGGVVDDCSGCSRLANHPVQLLDNDNLAMYLNRTRGWMRDDPSSFPRSESERRIMDQLEPLILSVRLLNERGLLDIVTGERS